MKKSIPLSVFNCFGTFYPNVYICGYKYDEFSYSEVDITEDVVNKNREILLNYCVVQRSTYISNNSFRRTDEENITLSKQYLIKLQDDKADMRGMSGALCFAETNLNWSCIGIQSGQLTEYPSYIFVQPIEIPREDIDLQLKGVQLSLDCAFELWQSYLSSKGRYFQRLILEVDNSIVPKKYEDKIIILYSFECEIDEEQPSEENQLICAIDCNENSFVRDMFVEVWTKTDHKITNCQRHSTSKLINAGFNKDYYPVFYFYDNSIMLVSIFPAMRTAEMPVTLIYEEREYRVSISYAFFGGIDITKS